MTDDFIVDQLYIAPVNEEDIISAEPGEKAYSLVVKTLGSASHRQQAAEMIEKAIPTSNTLGFEVYCECDFEVDISETFCADKSSNAVYNYGGHHPGGDNYPEACKFKPGEKVLCALYGGTNKVFPAIVVRPLTEADVVRFYEEDEMAQIGVDSAEEFVENWLDSDWDAVVVRPLVRLKKSWDEEMGETETVQRVNLFPFKEFDV